MLGAFGSRGGGGAFGRSPQQEALERTIDARVDARVRALLGSEPRSLFEPRSLPESVLRPSSVNLRILATQGGIVEWVDRDLEGEVESGFATVLAPVALTNTIVTLASITVDGGAGVKRMKIEGFLEAIGVATAGHTFELALYDGAAQVNRARGTSGVAGGVFPGYVMFAQDPFTGSKTFTLRARITTAAGTGTANASATAPGILLATWL